MSKIVNRAQLLTEVARARSLGRSIVHCHGCFDIVHPGHIRYLEFARRQGDVLVVSLTGDAAVAKAPQRPYIPQELRAENLAALEAVDWVFIDPHPTARELLSELKPDVYVKGREYENSNDPGFAAEREIVTSNGGKVLFSSGNVVFSSSRLIEALARDPSLDMDRLTSVCRRHDVNRGTLDALFERFRGLRALVVGDMVMDRYALCDATELAGEAPVMSLTQLEQREYIGGAGAVARHLAGLGAQTYLLTAGADDDVSKRAAGILEGDGIHTRIIKSRPDLPVKTRFLVDTTKVLRVQQGQAHPIDSRIQAEVLGWIDGLDRPEVVIFSDHGYGMVNRGLLEHVRAFCRRSPGVFLAGDASGPRGQLLQFRQFDLICPTERTLRSAWHDYERGLSTVAWNALDQTHARHLIVTMGKKGVVVFDRPVQDEGQPDWRGRLLSEYLPVLSEEQPVDALGVDSALLASATLTMAAGGSLMQGAYVGSAAAALESSCLGNVPISLAGLRRRLSTRLELTRSSRRGPGHVVRFASEDEEPFRVGDEPRSWTRREGAPTPRRYRKDDTVPSAEV